MTIPNSAIKYGLGLTYVQDDSENWQPLKNAWIQQDDGSWAPIKTGWVKHDDGSWQRIYPTPKGIFSPNLTTIAHSYYQNYADEGSVINVTNTGDFDLTINSIVASDETSVITYANTLPTFPITLTPGSSTDIRIIVGGNTVGFFTGTLNFTNHTGYFGFANTTINQTTTVMPDYADIELVGNKPAILYYKGDGAIDGSSSGLIQRKITVAPGVIGLKIEAAGGGGGGGGNDSHSGSAGYPGHKLTGVLPVSPGDVIAVNVGGGGGAGSTNYGGGQNAGSGGLGFVDVTQSLLNGSTTLYTATLGYAWSEFMNAHAVWVSSDEVNPVGSWVTAVRYVTIPSTGTYTFKIQADNTLNLNVDYTYLMGTSDFGSSSPQQRNIKLTAGSHRIQMDALNGGGPAGFAVQLVDGLGNQIWDTRTELSLTTHYNGGRGGYQGPDPWSGSGGGGGAATVIVKNGTTVLVAAGGGGGAGGGDYSSGKGQILGQNGVNTSGAHGIDHGGDGGGGGGGGGGYPGGIGGVIVGGDSGGYAGSDGYDLIPPGFVLGRTDNGGRPTQSGGGGYAKIVQISYDPSAEQAVYIRNSGNGAVLNITDITSENGYFAIYGLTSNNVGFNFIPGNYYGNQVHFMIAPYTFLDLGIYKDNIIITSNAKSNPVYKIPVTITVIEPNGNKVFETPGRYTWTVPDHVHNINVLLVGGGGGGGTGGFRTGGTGGGGGSGASNTWTSLPVIPGEVITVIVGDGGTQTGATGESTTITGSFGQRAVQGGFGGANAYIPTYYSPGGDGGGYSDSGESSSSDSSDGDGGGGDGGE